MNLHEFRASLGRPEHRFSETLAFIADAYDYQPSRFSNGSLDNAPGENEGSCKILGLAVLEGLSTKQALLAFGEHYRAVMATPDGMDHRNIRALMRTGLSGVRFEQQPLTRKAE